MRRVEEGRRVGDLIGRGDELAQLAGALADLSTGRGALWAVVGEPGIGKTRLASALAMMATEAGARVLWGRCPELQGAPAYWPWSQVLGTYLRGEDVPVGEPDLTYLGHLVPWLTDQPTAPPATSTTEQDRFYLFDAVSRTLRSAAAQRPLAVVLEDLHAADPPSLRLLQFLTADLTDVPLLVLATARPWPTTDRSSAAESTAAILRDALRPAHRIALGGLSRSEVGTLLAEWQPSSEVLSAVWDATEGNPFFALETARLLAVEGRLSALGTAALAVPEGVRHTIRQRLAPLDEDARNVLEAAAVVGAQFSLGVLTHCTDLPPDRIVTALGEATALGVLAQPRIDLGTYRFAHALIRETLYADLPASRRLLLHARVGEALTAWYGAEVDAHLDELAGHFLLAAPQGHQRQAADLAVRAGHAALADLAYEQAVRLLRQALELLAAEPAVDVDVYGEARLALGHALLRAGEPDAAKATFARAAEFAREHDRPQLLARAALGYGGQWVFSGETVDETVVSLLESALAALPDDEHELRARLLARLAEELYHSDQADRGMSCSARAVEIARGLGDPTTLGATLLARVNSLWRPTSPDNLHERLRLELEAIGLAERTAAAELGLDASAWRIIDLVEAGDVVGTDAQIAAFGRTAAVLRQPFYLWFVEVFAAMRSLMQGRYAEAEEHAEAALAIGHRAQGRRELEENAVGAHVIQMLLVLRERGPVAGVTGVEPAPVQQALDEFPQQPAWRAAVALRELARGNTTRARLHYDILAAEDFRALLVGEASLIAVCLTAELAAAFEDHGAAGRLYAHLAPFGGHHVVIGPPAIAYQGAVDLYLGLLAAARGGTDDALAHLDDALQRHAAMGAGPWSARTQYELARVHMARNRAGDRVAADQLLRSARRIAEDLGMGPLRERIANLAAAAPAAPQPTPGPPAPAVFRLEGEVWTATLGAETVRVKEVKGMHYLHRLLSHPGREFHVLDLAAATTRGTITARAANAEGMRVDDGGSGPLLDARAKEAYRWRLHELRAEVADAEELGHGERAARGEEEIDALARELSRAVGLGGRDRTSGSAAERARVNVSRAIRSAIARVGNSAPSLGHHLGTSVRTGSYCVYAPDPAATPDWDLGQGL